jgi:hypothetical protein
MKFTISQKENQEKYIDEKECFGKKNDENF